MQPVTDYVANQPEPAQSAVKHVYDMARDLVPGLSETVSYNMPCLKYGSKVLLSVMVTKQHIAIYPFSNTPVSILHKELDKAGFGYSKGAIRFQADKQLSDDLITRIILVRKTEIEENTKQK